MTFTITEVSKKTSLTAYTLRYYEKEGLLPCIARDKSGNRRFSQNDIEMILTIRCLKETGMPIKQIKKFVQWQMEGNDTLHGRNKMLIEHKKFILMVMEDFKRNLEKIDKKLEYYQNACEAYDNGSIVPICCTYLSDSIL